jgi:hypothetical protein
MELQFGMKMPVREVIKVADNNHGLEWASKITAQEKDDGDQLHARRQEINHKDLRLARSR